MTLHSKDIGNSTKWIILYTTLAPEDESTEYINCVFPGILLLLLFRGKHLSFDSGFKLWNLERKKKSMLLTSSLTEFVINNFDELSAHVNIGAIFSRHRIVLGLGPFPSLPLFLMFYQCVASALCSSQG